jgi:hypothetical protein
METFESVGEIAATLAGFSAILVAIQFERLKREIVAVQDFLLTALSAILFAFIPKLILPLVSEAAFWQLACGVFGVYHALLAGTLTYRHIRHRMLSVSEWLFLAASIAVIALKLAVGGGFFLKFGYEVYLLGLVWLLFNSIFMFYGLFFRVIWGSQSGS